MHDTATVASLVGERARATMLAALMDGRALTATELAIEAGVSPATASGHLSKLTRAKLVIPAAHGRHRYFRLASPEIARMLEAIMVVAAASSDVRQPTLARVDSKLKHARTCYDHLAGWLGVALADSMVGRGYIVLDDEAGQVTSAGREFLTDFGISPTTTQPTRRLYCRLCLDWSERRVHLAGVLGAALLDRLLERSWIRRLPLGRAVEVTRDGRRGLSHAFAIKLQ
jgi:DNA-binding transcriptional ArsR family regulator